MKYCIIRNTHACAHENKKERHSDVMNPKSFLFNFWGHLNSRHTLLFFFACIFAAVCFSFFFSPASDAISFYVSAKFGGSPSPQCPVSGTAIPLIPTSRNVLSPRVPRAVLSVYALLCPLRRMPSDDFSQKSHFSHISIVQNLHISKKMRIFALDFKSVLFPVWSNRLWPYIPMSYNLPLHPATASIPQPPRKHPASPRFAHAFAPPRNRLDLKSRFYNG